MADHDAPGRAARDEELMLAVGQGDLASLDVLYRRHVRTLHDLCYRLVGGEAADDLVQETFVRILRHRRSFRGNARFTTWMYRIARNACVDHLQRRRRRERARERYGTTDGSAGFVAAHEPPAGLRILERALALISDEKREVIILSRYYDLSHAEIAEVLGCSVGAVKVRVHRAMKELRELIHALERERDEVSGSRSANS